ncbi:MAG: O-antigen ligase family protein [Chloroflexi bacterium]|nr:O-antigen ligase family protein [Chloroflexota bacterium]
MTPVRDSTPPSRARLAIHVAYFGFAIAALVALSLLVPQQTSRAPAILLGGFGVWAVACGARVVWNRRDPVAITVQPAHLFVPVLVATYTVLAFDATPEITQFSPSSPDSMPGLHIDQHAYFVAVLCMLAAFSGWYGMRKGRLVESMLGVQIVLISVMYERMLAGTSSVPPLVLMATALALLRFLPLDGPARPVERSAAWIALPLAIFVLVALLATATSAYPALGLAAAGKMLALAVVAVVLFDTVREDRQRWLVWIAVAAPAVAEAALVMLKVAQIAREMGATFALRNRIEPAAGLEPNPLGLSLALGVLLVAGAMPHVRTAAARWAGAIALAVLLPALVLTYSVGSLLGLACGLVALAVVEGTRPRKAGVRGPARLVPLALFCGIGLVVAAAYAMPGPVRDSLRATVDDPTTGRSRVHLWEWALRDFKANPVLGVGPTVYWPRVRYVPDFTYRDVTKMLERRRLLGQDSTQWRFLFVTHPHNLLIDIAEGMGVLGLAAFAGVAATGAWGSLRVLRARLRPDRWFTGLGVAMLVAVAAWSMGSVGVQIALVPLPVWIALALVAAAHRPDGESAVFVVPGWLPLPGARAAGALALVAVLLVFVVRPVGSLAAIARANDRAAAGDTTGNANALRLAAAFDPLDIGVLALLANNDLRRGDAAAALSRMRAVDTRAPRNGLVLTGLGEISWLAGDSDAAERYLREAIREDRWQVLNADPYTPLGLLLLTRGDAEGAKAALADGLRVSPVNVRDRAWLRDGADLVIDRAYAAGASPSGSAPLRDALQRRMLLSPGVERSGTAGSLRLTEVLAVLESEARATLPRDTGRAAEILHQAGLAYQFAGLHDEAARVLRAAAAADPAASYIRYDLAQSEIALGDDAAASRELEEVVRIARASRAYDLRIGFAERDLALIAMRAQRYEDAARLMRSALDDYRWAYLPQAYSTLTEAYEKLRQPDEAATWRDRELFLQGR